MAIPAPNALARFGLGPRPGDTARVAHDPKAALLAELRPDIARLKDPDLPSVSQAVMALQSLQQTRKAARQGDKDAEQALKGMQQPGRIYLVEIAARLDRATSAEIGFVERLVAFWANHFAVSASTGQMQRILVGAYERDAIRPHVLGRFTDMALAATRHAAMLTYLNNAVSVGPDSPFGQRSGKGLNENHARELMELHTIGVTGGYTQDDVIALAKALTGWSVARGPKDKAPAGSFLFGRSTHEPGPQTIMGKRYDQPGEEQALAVIDDLAASPRTARHVATKLARAFVADDPPPTLVDRLAEAFTESGGDLMNVSRTLVESEEAWSGPGKFKDPQLFVWSAVRAFGLKRQPAAAVKVLRTLGQLPWNPPSPAGYDTTAATWLAPNALSDRLDAASLMAGSADPTLDPKALAADLLGDGVSRETTQAVARAESRAQALTLLLMSPEFQRT